MKLNITQNELPKKIDSLFLKTDPSVGNVFILNSFHTLLDLSELYPNFEKWLWRKALPGIVSGERSLLLEYVDNKLAGLAIIKDNQEEKKICCIRILPEYQKAGIGKKLFQRCFEELKTNNPLISVSESNVNKFKKLFNYFGFELGAVYDSLYQKDKKEFSFNGSLYVPKDEIKVAVKTENKRKNKMGII